MNIQNEDIYKNTILDNKLEKISSNFNIKIFISIFLIFILFLFLFYKLRQKNKVISELDNSLKKNISDLNTKIKKNIDNINKYKIINDRINKLKSIEEFTIRLDKIETYKKGIDTNSINSKKNLELIKKLQNKLSDYEEIKNNIKDNTSKLNYTKENMVKRTRIEDIEKRIDEMDSLNKENSNLPSDSTSRINNIEERMNIFDSHYKKLYSVEMSQQDLKDKFNLTEDEARELKTYNETISNLQNNYSKIRRQVLINRGELRSIRNKIRDTVNDMFENSFIDSSDKMKNVHFTTIKADNIIFDKMNTTNNSLKIGEENIDTNLKLVVSNNEIEVNNDSDLTKKSVIRYNIIKGKATKSMNAEKSEKIRDFYRSSETKYITNQDISINDDNAKDWVIKISKYLYDFKDAVNDFSSDSVYQNFVKILNSRKLVLDNIKLSNLETNNLNVSKYDNINVGTISYFATNNVPFGWLECDGRFVSKTIYNKLYKIIGDYFGVNKEGTKFKIPDLRGQFIRGWSNSHSVDMNRRFGSIQESSNKEHSHIASASNSGNHNHTMKTSGHHNHSMNNAGHHNHWIDVSREYGCNRSWSSHCHAGNIRGSRNTSHHTHGSGNHAHHINHSGNHTHDINNSGNHNHRITIQNDGEKEARPTNMALLVCIKY